MRVRGIACDMRADGTGPVDALVIGDVRGSVLVNVINFITFKTVAQADRCVLADGVADTDGIADGVPGEVIPVIVHVVQVIAERKVRIIHARVGEGQRARSTAPREETLQRKRVALAKQVTLHDGTADAHVKVRGIADTGHEGTGIAFLDLDLQINLVFLVRGNEFVVHGLEVTELIETFHGTSELCAVILITVAKPHFTQNDVISGFRISFHDDPADKDFLLLVNDVDHINSIGMIRRLDHTGINLGVGVAMIVIILLQGLGVFLHRFKVEIFLIFLPVIHFDDLVHVLLGVENITGEAHFIDIVAGAFADREMDVNAVLLIRYFR